MKSFCPDVRFKIANNSPKCGEGQAGHSSRHDSKAGVSRLYMKVLLGVKREL